MSYEGSCEYLCKRGHYHSHDCYMDNAKVCPQCGQAWAYVHSIDHTNGIVDDDPNTFHAERREVGFDDRWTQDHHGNKYAIKIPRFKPAPKSAWQKQR